MIATVAVVIVVTEGVMIGVEVGTIVVVVVTVATTVKDMTETETECITLEYVDLMIGTAGIDKVDIRGVDIIRTKVA